jgi:hypothetical protein
MCADTSRVQMAWAVLLSASQFLTHFRLPANVADGRVSLQGRTRISAVWVSMMRLRRVWSLRAWLGRRMHEGQLV